MGGDEILAQIQTKPGTRWVTRTGYSLPEALEKVTLLFLFHANAIVFNLNCHLVGIGGTDHINAAIIGAKFDGIIYQIRDDLMQCSPVRQNQKTIVRGIYAQRNALA